MGLNHFRGNGLEYKMAGEHNDITKKVHASLNAQPLEADSAQALAQGMLQIIRQEFSALHQEVNDRIAEIADTKGDHLDPTLPAYLEEMVKDEEVLIYGQGASSSEPVGIKKTPPRPKTDISQIVDTIPES